MKTGYPSSKQDMDAFSITSINQHPHTYIHIGDSDDHLAHFTRAKGFFVGFSRPIFDSHPQLETEK